MIARLVVGLVAIVAAAACTERKQAPPQPAAKSARSESARLAAVSQCAAAFGKLRDPRETDVVVAVMTACAAMRGRPPCRAALAAATGLDGARAAMLGPCRDAYCPDLPEPRPAACKATEAGDDVAVAELDAAILSLEYGISREAAARISLFSSVAVDSAGRRIELPAAPAEVRATIRLTAEAAGLTATMAARVWHLPAAPAARDFADLLAALPPQPRDVTVTVETDEQVPHGAVIALLTALKEKGYVRLALATRAN